MDSNSSHDAAKDFAWLLLPKVPEGTYTSPLSTVVYLALFTDEFCFVITMNLKFISVKLLQEIENSLSQFLFPVRKSVLL